ncbi:MAG: succinate dehydrogenase cytochrome b subunit [Acidimicrobiia bacterium]|nr:succinate dehydrogenase cytochrome b subunit [Acidimicrobiia bacterium]
MTTTTTAPDEQVRRKLPWFLEIYRSYVGRKWVMAITGIVLLGYVAAHMIGNLKVYFGPEEINEYGEALRDLGGHLLPRTHLLWLLRIGLIAAFVLHIHAAYSLAASSNAARGPEKYSRRDYVAANYASRTMRWTGTIVLLFLLWHLADLTWGVEPFAADGWERGDVYGNLVASFERVPVAAIYIVANVALAAHIYHGMWSLFQSMGWSNPRFNRWRRWASYGFAAVVLVGNLSFPIAVLGGLVD